MKALDKVFDTQVITQALLVINFISLKQKKISYMKKEENRQERRYQSYNRYESRKFTNVSFYIFLFIYIF